MNQGLSQRGQGGNAPTKNPFCPPRQFRNLANLEEALQKMQWCFHIWPSNKAFTSDHLFHVLISILIVFLSVLIVYSYNKVVQTCGSGAKFGSLEKFIWLLCVLLCVMHFGFGG